MNRSSSEFYQGRFLSLLFLLILASFIIAIVDITDGDVLYYSQSRESMKMANVRLTSRKGTLRTIGHMINEVL